MTAPYMFVFRSPGIMPFVAVRAAPETGRSAGGSSTISANNPYPPMLEDTIKNYLITSAGVDPAKFAMPGLQVADLALDSLGLLEMLFEIEDKYGFQVPEPMRFLAMSFTEMVADIESTVRAHHGGQLPALDAEKAAC